MSQKITGMKLSQSNQIYDARMNSEIDSSNQESFPNE